MYWHGNIYFSLEVLSYREWRMSRFFFSVGFLASCNSVLRVYFLYSVFVLFKPWMHDVVKVCGAKHCCVVTSVSQPPTFPCSAWASQASEVCLVSGRREFPLLTVCVRRQRHLQLQQPLKLSGTNIRKTAWTDGKGVFENTTSQLPHQIYVCNVKLIFLFSRI